MTGGARQYSVELVIVSGTNIMMSGHVAIIIIIPPPPGGW